MLSKFKYNRAKSVKEAVEMASQPGSSVLAGGTDLLGCLRDRVFAADRVVSISGLQELKGIARRTGGGLRIGALTTVAAVAEDDQVRQLYPVLAMAAASVASPQLRHQGTIGGNICQRPRCWYFRGDFHCVRKGGDTCFAMTGENQYHCILGGAECIMVHPSDTAPALVALDAKFRVAGRSGVRTVPASSFFVLPQDNTRKENVLNPGELITEILLDPPEPGARSTYRKVRERGAFDFALAGAALALTVADGKVTKARVVLSGVAPAPWRAVEAEKALLGKALDPATAAAAAALAVKGSLAQSENGYKIPLAAGMLEETLTSLAS